MTPRDYPWKLEISSNLEKIMNYLNRYLFHLIQQYSENHEAD